MLPEAGSEKQKSVIDYISRYLLCQLISQTLDKKILAFSEKESPESVLNRYDLKERFDKNELLSTAKMIPCQPIFHIFFYFSQ